MSEFDSATQIDELDGHTIEELSDYLDRGYQPAIASIDQSSGCQIVLNALRRLRALSASLLEQEALAEQPRDDRWVQRILGQIGLEARAGREIPFQAPVTNASLGITEGAVRGIIRAAGDAVGGAIIGRCRLDGNVSVADEPIIVSIDLSVVWGTGIPAVVERIRAAVLRDLAIHTELNILAVDVTVHDIQPPDRKGDSGAPRPVQPVEES